MNRDSFIAVPDQLPDLKKVKSVWHVRDRAYVPPSIFLQDLLFRTVQQLTHNTGCFMLVGHILQRKGIEVPPVFKHHGGIEGRASAACEKYHQE